MRRSLLAVLIALACAAPSLAKDRKTLGDVADPGTLLKVKSYCIDAQGAPEEVAEARKFAEAESGPKKALGRLGWTRAEDCKEADAVISFTFAQTTTTRQAGDSASVQMAGSIPVSSVVATLNISDPSSGKLIYRVKGEATESTGYRSMVNSVQKLEKDLKKLSG